MIQIKDKITCCGCTACFSICPHEAIVMTPDSLGFLYPKVNTDLCVNCGLCDKVCEFHNNYNRYKNYDIPRAYQFRINDSIQLKKSQSGGAFFSIAQAFIKKGGIVYGAAFTKTWKVTHQKINNLDSLETLRMSKYVQSDMRDIFYSVKNDLKNGFNILFSGTACQIAGLKSYIPNRLHDKLFCIDIICHGVPSPKIWEDYISYLETSKQSKLVKVCFRDKRFGWHGATESFLFDNGTEVFRKTSNHLYFTGLSMRECCSKCYYANTKRVGDITLGDQWRISKTSPFNDNKGLSLILINSEKGEELFKYLKSPNIIESIPLQECIQPQLQHPSKINPLHETFIKEYEQKGFLYIAKKYSDMGWRYHIKQLLTKIKILIYTLFKR